MPDPSESGSAGLQALTLLSSSDSCCVLFKDDVLVPIAFLLHHGTSNF